MDSTTALIKAEISKALELLDAPAKLRGIVGSWGDTLTDESVLELLREWNATGSIAFEQRQTVH